MQARTRPQVYNAIKISRYWHGDLWRDDYAANVHYICGKPWKEPPRLTKDGQLDVGDFAEPCEAVITGHGCDTVTHSWWWREYYAMTAKMERADVELMGPLVVEPTDDMRQWLETTLDEGAVTL